jgi:hypothetical protein
VSVGRGNDERLRISNLFAKRLLLFFWEEGRKRKKNRRAFNHDPSRAQNTTMWCVHRALSLQASLLSSTHHRRVSWRQPTRAPSSAAASSHSQNMVDVAGSLGHPEDGIGAPKLRVIPQKYLVGEEEEALAALILSGAVDINARAEHSGKSPIHLAAWRGSVATVCNGGKEIQNFFFSLICTI